MPQLAAIAVALFANLPGQAADAPPVGPPASAPAETPPAAEPALAPMIPASVAPVVTAPPAPPPRPGTTLATPEELLAQVVAPPEFDVTIFANSDQANYPVSVAAAPDGTLYVASDANGSLGVDLGRGLIIRLRDLDGDGKADEVKQFAKVDSPRGLVWDGDRAYVMHPPHLSAFIDHDGDGVSDEQRILVKDIAFSFRDRPADHTSNGVTLGVDGWLYLAIGDFGFLSAEGTDGRKLQLRGGGVVRVRPDGTGLELYARGTRNILEVALSPRLDGIARDNTNDGDGWDVRLHHFTGLEDHGYPTLYKNFAAEAIGPLAIYGNGSACGALWLEEPGMPAKWNAGPLTVDWGRERVYRHTLTPQGATVAATQEEFAKLPRATDMDVDAQSRLYVSSWRGGQYTYAGPYIGFIARLTPKDYQPLPVPNFARASGAELVALFNSPSYRTRLEAQRTLLRRGLKNETAALETLSADPAASLDARIQAVFTLKQGLGEASHAFLARLAADPSISAWAIRALTDREDQLARVPEAPILAGLRSGDSRTRLEAIVAVARLGRPALAAALASSLGDADPVIAHTVVQALVRLRDTAVSFAALDDVAGMPARRTDAMRVLQAQHDEKVVDQLIARLSRETEPARREDIVRGLCRLFYREAQWTGDSWGTRPDARGPYYQPERWAGSTLINPVLKGLLDRAEGDEIVRLNEIFTLYRVTPGDTTARLIALAESDNALLPALALQLAGADNVPASAVPLLQKALTWVPPPPAPPLAPPPPPPVSVAEPSVATSPSSTSAVVASPSVPTPPSTTAGAAVLPAPTVSVSTTVAAVTPGVTPAGAGAPGGRGGGRGGPRPVDTGPIQLNAMQALVKADTPEAIAIVLAALPTLQNRGRLGDGVRDKSANALFQSATLANHSRLFADEAAKSDAATAVWADAALLHLAARKFGSPETRAFAAGQLDDGWLQPARRAQIIRAAALGREATRAPVIVKALEDADSSVAEAAKEAIATLKLDVEAIRAESAQQAPAIATLKPEETLALVLTQRGTAARGEQIFNQAGCV
ncbi:MAG: hypothetical protein ABIZ81_03090, partial [Opitutaceae bacterium]